MGWSSKSCRRIHQNSKGKKDRQIIRANSLMVDSVERDPELKEASHNADLVLTDSIGIVWASEFLACGKVARIPRIDLMLKFCRLASSTGYSVYLLGPREFVLKKATENLEKKFIELRIVGTHNGYFGQSEDDRILKEIRNLKPDFLFLGIGTPHGESAFTRTCRS